MSTSPKTGTRAAQDRRRGPGFGNASRHTRVLLVAVALLTAWFQSATTLAPAPLLSGSVTGFAPDTPPLALPAFTILGEDGAPLPDSLLEGRLIVLNFWATWCGPCLHEMPSLNALQGRYDPRDVLVVTLSVDRAGARAVKKFYADRKLGNLGIYLDPKGGTMRMLGVMRLPTTLLLDGTERRLGVLEGVAEWDSAEARALIDYYRALRAN